MKKITSIKVGNEIYKISNSRDKHTKNLECLECGKQFYRSLKTYDIKCPKCNGVDIEPI